MFGGYLLLPALTHHLKIEVNSQEKDSEVVKEKVKDWLIFNGRESFEEGAVEDISVDFDYDNPDRDMYREFGGAGTPISIYDYSREDLVILAEKLQQFFGAKVTLSLDSLVTEVWTEGWKESFKPIFTERFHIRAPWHPHTLADGVVSIEIEPGMAFGTGQHGTTQLCLFALESLVDETQGVIRGKVMDVGTGTGILAIAAKKLGCELVDACDVDPFSIASAQSNATINGVAVNVWQGSVPVDIELCSQGCPPYQLVFANILMVVLKKIIGDLASITSTGGCLVMSGLLVEDEAEMLSLCQPHGLTLKSRRELDGWSCLVMEKA
jgi:ribosomal protein L11 methyltransferase